LNNPHRKQDSHEVFVKQVQIWKYTSRIDIQRKENIHRKVKTTNNS